MDTKDKNNQDKQSEGDKSNGDLTALKEKIEYLEKEQKQLIQQRDEVKQKLRKIDEDEAIKKGEYEKVIASANSELEKLKSEFESAKQYETKFNELDKRIRAEALEKLSDEHKKIAESLPTDLLQDYVKINSKQSAGMDTGTNGRGAVDLSGKKWQDFSSVELEDIKKNNESGYMKLYRERFSKV